MKTIKAYEYEDLAPDIQQKVLAENVELGIECMINRLNSELINEVITEEEYYEELGCSKSYADSTPWFVPSCYYDAHKEEINAFALEDAQHGLYDKYGKVIGCI